MARENVLCGRLGSRKSQDPCITVNIWDTGASFGLAPFKGNFIDDVRCDIPVKDVKKFNTVIWIGTTIHKFADANGKYVFLLCISYHIGTTYVRLFLSTKLSPASLRALNY